MKTSIKILFLAVIMAAISACSAQKRAERHIRRAVELCPDLVQMTAHPIDTFLSVPGYTDISRVPLVKVFENDAVFVGTEHGTFALSMDKNDSTLTVSFSADRSEIHYQDTIHHAQVNIPEPKPEERKERSCKGLSVWLFGIIVGMGLYFYWFKSDKKETTK